MKQKRWYYSLQCRGGNDYHPSGQLLKFDAPVVMLGDAGDCDVRYDAGPYRPECYAAIVRNDDGHSWRIVRRSPHVGITIVGQGDIGYGRQLADGDIIRFDGQTMGLRFCIHHDDRFEVQADGRQGWRWATVAAMVFAALALLPLLAGRRTIDHSDVAPLEQSIYSVRVDSVQQLLVVGGVERVINTCVLAGQAPTGTAFLTTDSLLVTARHCVEYWLGTDLDLTCRVEDLSADDVVRWAIETETFGQTHARDCDTAMVLRAHFSVYDFLGEKRYSFASTDSCVHINRERDGVFVLADFAHEYYWRSIRPYFADTRMAMGDIVWIDGLPQGGQVQLASRDDLGRLRRGDKVMVCGYPMTALADKQVMFAHGSIVRQPQVEGENIFIESNINHGYSGGPVMALVGSKVLAVGLVSRVDSVSSGLYKWAVPVTEIKRGGER